MLTPEQRAQYDRDGFIVLPNFKSPGEIAALRRRAEEIVDAFDPNESRAIFTTRDQARASDEWFLGSDNTIRCFFEEEAFGPDGQLRQAKALSINKIGHARPPLDPTFAAFSMGADIAALAKIARAHGLLLVVDNTFATPFCQQPLALGADIVMHSATKYLNGHSDIIGGVLVAGNVEVAKEIKFLQNSVGGVMGPFDAFLANRGLKTLGLRMKAHCESALEIARWLETRAGIAKVIYPGLISHPQHELAARQMRGFGGMVSVMIDGDLERTKRVLERFQVFTLAESLGGVESLVNHPAIMTHASVPKEVREAGGVTDNLIRLSVGVEDVADLIADLDQALA
jgi:O-acetylhomoserine/O-acetylserine sulfhydrylase-like pyridoxal-dependent enzyme